MISVSLNDQLKGELLRDELMSRYTTWRTGGPADCLYKPANLADLQNFLRQLPEGEPLFWIGLGSNLLVRDGGIRGTVVATQGCLNEMAILEDGCVRIEAGVSSAKAARFCSSHALQGVEFLAGIPGTIGGALAMNAGAFGGETWRHVVAVETINRQGEVRRRPAAEFQVGYRSVQGLNGEWFVAAHLKLQQCDKNKQLEMQQQMKKLLAMRNEKQPIGLPSCGSVFRNPEGAHAAQLIEASGLKGFCIGGAAISEKHANFIINTGNATSADIESLIDYVTDRVFKKQGIRLQKEAHITGEPLSEQAGGK